MSIFFFFNDTATTEIYTLSLHDALPICSTTTESTSVAVLLIGPSFLASLRGGRRIIRSEEHTSELQLPDHLVCRLLLEKKNSLQTHNVSRWRRIRHLSIKLILRTMPSSP